MSPLKEFEEMTSMGMFYFRDSSPGRKLRSIEMRMAALQSLDDIAPSQSEPEWADLKKAIDAVMPLIDAQQKQLASEVSEMNLPAIELEGTSLHQIAVNRESTADKPRQRPEGVKTRQLNSKYPLYDAAFEMRLMATNSDFRGLAFFSTEAGIDGFREAARVTFGGDDKWCESSRRFVWPNGAILSLPLSGDATGLRSSEFSCALIDSGVNDLDRKYILSRLRLRIDPRQPNLIEVAMHTKESE